MKTITVKVTPNAKKTELKKKGDVYHVRLQATPEKGKANEELVKFFKKKLGLRVKIKSGQTSRKKVLEILS